MNITRKANPLCMATLPILVLILIAGASAHNCDPGWQGIAQTLPDAQTADLFGGLHLGACGIVAGIAIGVVALGASTVTVGLGGAAVLSVGAHLAALYCAM